MNNYKISKKYLSFRDEARELFEPVGSGEKDVKAKEFSFDFSEVIFFSRSFADELLNYVNKLKKRGISVKIINLKPDLREFLDSVRNKKAEIQKEVTNTR